MGFVVVNAAPIHGRVDNGLIRKIDAFHDPIFKDIKAGAVHDVADVFFSRRRIGIDVLFYIAIGVFNDLNDGVFVGPFDEIFAETRVALARATEKSELIIFSFERVQARMGQ